MDLSFKTVPKIEAGIGKLSILADTCKNLDIKRPIIITDEGLIKIGLVKKIINRLKDVDLPICIYQKVLADPPERNIFEAVELFKNFKADGVIGFGGGSSMDVAKAVSFFCINNIPIEKCYGLNNLTNKRLPLIQIPTTAGTGSEVTPIAILL